MNYYSIYWTWGFTPNPTSFFCLDTKKRIFQFSSSFFCLDTKKRSKKKSRLCLLRSKN